MSKNKLLIKEDYEKFWNVNRLYSYQNISTFILVGGRGIGKTTGVKIKALKNYLNKGEEFVYVRRYKSEIKRSRGLFDNIYSEIKTKGIGEGSFEYKLNDKRMGYGVALTIQQTLKSGIDFSKVTTIIFDEAILKRGGAYRYLNDDVICFLELVSTIVRERTNYKIFIIGNNADIFNEYFEFFDLPKFDNVYIDNERGLYCEMCKTKAQLLEAEKATPLYKLTMGTNYHDYHYNNELLVSNTCALSKKINTDKLIYRIVYNNITLNVYMRKGLKLFIELRDKIILDNISFNIMTNNKPNYYYVKEFRNSEIKKFTMICLGKNDIQYDSYKTNEIFNMFIEEIK